MRTMILMICVIFLFCTSCDWFQNLNTNPQDIKNSTILVDDIEIIDIQCLHWSVLGKTIVIDNDSDYQVLRQYKMSYKDTCLEVILPEIDFNKNTLLGMHTGCAGCCSPDYEYEVNKNDEDKKYEFIISQTQNGLCEVYQNRYHWITIPKKEKEYNVVFEQKVIAIKDTCE